MVLEVQHTIQIENLMLFLIKVRTSIMNDTEEALFLYQIDHLAYNMQPEEFYEVIKKNVPNGPFSHEFKNLQGDAVTLKQIAEDLKRDYEFLYSNYNGMPWKRAVRNDTFN